MAVASHQSRQLAKASALLTNAVSNEGDPHEAGLQLLEACAARVGGFAIDTYWNTFGVNPILSDRAGEHATALVEALEMSGLPVAMGLSALAQEDLSPGRRQATGAFHTDFRLARELARALQPSMSSSGAIIDPASGTGMLLVAAVLELCGSDRTRVAGILSTRIRAADISSASLRGARLALASLTHDLDVVKTMVSHWYQGDALLAGDAVWNRVAPLGVDAVIANPPWEKVKASRHEWLRAQGHNRNYGSDMDEADLKGFASHRSQSSGYSERIRERYQDVESGEVNLYQAFAALSHSLVATGGQVSVLLPGALIRAQGATALRKRLLDEAERLRLTLFTNRARYFEIDTRFKFVHLDYTVSRDAEGRRARRSALMLHMGDADDNEVSTKPAVALGRRKLEALRPDLTLPEVRNRREWSIVTRMSEFGTTLSHGWPTNFCREADMTRFRRVFRDASAENALPVIEGRMVQQYRFGCKTYVRGRGRSAEWHSRSLGNDAVEPQFYLDKNSLPTNIQHRSEQRRVGFCDIAGQTNERTLMAASIPAGVVCGNKVPTLLLGSEDEANVWLGIVNSIALDWFLRRVMTTTVNFFILRSVPFPRIARDTLPWREIAKRVAGLSDLVNSQSCQSVWTRHANLRAAIDVLVLRAYGLSCDDAHTMFEDFPLLDRGQPALASEARSTVTRDMVLGLMGCSKSAERATQARKQGAVAYIHHDFSALQQSSGNDLTQDCRGAQ